MHLHEDTQSAIASMKSGASNILVSLFCSVKARQLGDLPNWLAGGSEGASIKL
jgi:hypothetical protein